MRFSAEHEVPDRAACPQNQQHDDPDQPPFEEGAATARLIEAERRILVNIRHRTKFRFPSPWQSRLRTLADPLQQIVDLGLAAAQRACQLARRRALVDDLVNALLAADLDELL